MKKKLLVGVTVGLMMFGVFGVAQATYIEYASAVNPDNGHSYYIYYSPVNLEWPYLDYDNTNDITWDDAKVAAESMGGYLATITSPTEEIFLQSENAFAGSVKGEGIRAWIGLSDIDEEGQFKWVSGPEQGQVLSYADWMNGEPNNVGNEDYVEWRNYPYGPMGGAWNDVPSDAWGVNSFMVEMNPVPEPATILLMGIGLTGLVAARRKKKA